MRRKLTGLLLTAAVSSAALCVTPLLHADGTYYLQSAGGIGSAPYPYNPCSSVPVIEVSPGVYLVEDGSGSQTKAVNSSMTAGVQADDSGFPPTPGGGDDGGTNSYPSPQGRGQPIDYSGLWIECTNQGGGNLGLNLHNTIYNDNYEEHFS